MNQWTLKLHDVVPYVRTTQKMKRMDKDYRRYAAWKAKMRLFANTRYFPQELDKRYVYEIHTCVTWEGVGRADIDNCGLKNVLDALWPQKSGGDGRIKRASVEVIDNYEYTSITVTLLEKLPREVGGKASVRNESRRPRRAPPTDPYSKQFRTNL